jgi:hypothetical protein
MATQAHCAIQVRRNTPRLPPAPSSVRGTAARVDRHPSSEADRRPLHWKTLECPAASRPVAALEATLPPLRAAVVPLATGPMVLARSRLRSAHLPVGVMEVSLQRQHWQLMLAGKARAVARLVTRAFRPEQHNNNPATGAALPRTCSKLSSTTRSARSPGTRASGPRGPSPEHRPPRLHGPIPGSTWSAVQRRQRHPRHTIREMGLPPRRRSWTPASSCNAPHRSTCQRDPDASRSLRSSNGLPGGELAARSGAANASLRARLFGDRARLHIRGLWRSQ